MKMREKRERESKELTEAGLLFCMISGLLLETGIFLAMGIEIGQVSVIVLVFLWCLLGILVSGAILEVLPCVL